MLNIKLTETELTEVKRLLKKYVPNCEVWAFGSRVSGNAKPFSDLDLVIFSKSENDFNRILDLKDAFSVSNLPFKVDIVDWGNIDDYFREIIKSNYIVLIKP